ncbi:MAG: AAA family ATPase [Marinicaulis sp.]|nr:AAA family ATPase [Marinicaulis sp.]
MAGKDGHNGAYERYFEKVGNLLLIERKDELAALLSWHRHTREGRGGIVFVRGEAGLGKTSLITALCDQVREINAVFWGGCEALYTPRPLGPLFDMMDSFSDDVRLLLNESGRRSIELYSRIVSDFEKSSPGDVLVIEDIHWADFATLDFLKYLGRRITAAPILVILSFRTDEITEESKVQGVLDGFPAAFVHDVELKPLTRSGVEKLCASSGRRHQSDEYYGVSGGNPFFVTELLASGERPHAALPASVKDAVNTRLLRLSPEERDFLETLSILPGAIQFSIIPRLFGDDGELLAMAALGRKLLLETPGKALRFRHELARLATLARVPATRQREIHARVLRALLDSNDQDTAHDQLVHHAAGALDAEMVLKFAPRAAENAAAVGAHQEAASHYATAMRFVDEADADQAAEIYEKWAYEAGLSLRIDDEVIKAYQHAITLWRALGRQDKVAENLTRLSRMHWYRAESAEAARYADEAVRLLEEAPPSAAQAMGYSLKSQLYMLNDKMEDAITWGEKALELAERFDDAESRVHALNNVGVARAFRGDSSGVDLLEVSLSLALEHGYHEHAARVFTNLSEYGVEFKNFDLAERTISEGVAFDTKNDLDSWTHYLIGRQAQLRCEQGRLHDARTIAEGVLRLERQTLLMKLPARLVLAKVNIMLGDDAAQTVLAEAVDHAAATEEPQHIVPAHLSRLLFAWLHDKARIAEESLRQLFDIGADAMHLWHRGETAVWCNRFAYPIPEEFRDGLPPPIHQELDGKLKVAAATWKKLGAIPAIATTLAQSRESDQLGAAIQISRDIGAAAIEEKVLRLASRFGIASELPKKKRGPYKAARNHPLGLTEKEQKVLSLLVEGHSNSDIAEILSRSRRTVENHVSSILRKLSVEHRVDAAILVQSEPWLLPKIKPADRRN